MNVQVYLVSAQAAANLLPALDPALKPDKAVLIVSPKMQRQADNLKKAMQEAGVEVTLQLLEDEHNYSRTEEQLLELAGEYEGDNVTLNITGGTKLMSLAAQKAADAAEWRMFYVDMDTDQVNWLNEGKQHSSQHTLSEQLRLRHYLQGYGFSLPSKPVTLQITPQQQQLTETLIQQIGSLEKPLSQLNWLGQQAEDRKSLSVTLNEWQRDSRGLEVLLRDFEEAGALSEKDGRLTFADETQRAFVKGGWLEAHVSKVLNSLKTDLSIRDSAANLMVEDNGGVKNELDIAFMARNRLFLIECKTARMDKPEAAKANDALFKLAEIGKRVGGRVTRSMLVSYRKLKDSEIRLAKALNIELVCGAEFVRLDEKLKKWVGR
ncbi:MAG: Card1-like endonuclease domain-containing protein [Shewanella algae]